jgi:hypothetical protein
MPTNRFTVWKASHYCDVIDKICDTKVQAKKRAAWLLFSLGGLNCRHRPYITDALDKSGDHVDYSDYQFVRGESRKVTK